LYEQNSEREVRSSSSWPTIGQVKACSIRESISQMIEMHLKFAQIFHTVWLFNFRQVFCRCFPSSSTNYGTRRAKKYVRKSKIFPIYLLQ